MNLALISRSIVNASFAAMILLGAFTTVEVTAAEYQSQHVDIDCPDEELKKVVRKYLKERIHYPLTQSKLRDAMSVLYKIGGIKKVDIFEDDSKFVVKLIPLQRLEDVKVYGNSAFSDDHILATMNLSEDTTQYFSDVDGYRKSILSIYKDAGYIKASVDFELRNGKSHDLPTLYVNIMEGTALLLDSLDIIGDIEPLENNDIFETLRLTLGEPADPHKMEERIERLRLFFVDQGYLTTHLALDEPDINREDNTISLKLNVDRGPKFEVDFHGEKYFLQDRDSILNKAIGISNETRFSKAYLEDAKQRLIEFYQRLGYTKVKVDYDDNLHGKTNLRQIAFKIAKGPRTKIRRIFVEGNSTLTASKIVGLLPRIDLGDAYFKTEFRRAVNTLQSSLQELGFHDSKEASFREVFSENKRYVDLVVTVDEGILYKFGQTNIHVIGDISPENFRDLLRYEVESPFVISKYEQSVKDIRKQCLNLGYKFCTLEAEAKPSGNQQKTVDIKVSTGERVRVGSFFVKGNRITADRVILREMRFSQNDLFNPEKISASQRAIQRLGFFTSVRIIELAYDPVDKVADYIIEVRERDQRNIRFRIGFGSEEGGRVRSDFSYLNLGGTGRNFYLSTGSSRRVPGDIFEWIVVANYIEPYLFSLPVNGRVQFSFERAEEEFGNIDRTALFLGAEYVRLSWLQALAGWELEFREPFDLKVAEEDLSDFDEARRRFGSIGTVLTFDFRDDPFNPRFGYLGRVQTDLFLESFLSEEEFYQVFTRNTFYLPLVANINLLFSIRAGFSATLGSTAANGSVQIPIEKRFRLGGSQSLRGFSLDSVGGQGPNEPALSGDEPASGGNSMFNYLAELQFPIAAGFKVVAFTDGGNAFLTNSDFDPTNLRYSAGVGLRYITPIGPLRLDFGIKLDRRTGESLGEVHFAVGSF